MSRVEENEEMIRDFDESAFCILTITDRILADISKSLAIIADSVSQPKQRTGQWEKVTAENRDGSISWWYACSECGAPCLKTDYGTDYFGSYCSECGSRMLEVEEE